MLNSRTLVSPTSSPLLERALRHKLQRRNEVGGSLGGLGPLAVRLGLMQNSLKPVLYDPQLLVLAADHGLAVEGISDAEARPTHDTVRMLLTNQLPLAVFAREQQLEVTVVDCGMAQTLPPHDRLLIRKIAHGTRNVRSSPAMSAEQAHAGMRAGMEIGDKLQGNVTVLAGVGVGANESAALVLSRLTRTSVRELVTTGPDMAADYLSHLMTVLKVAKKRHRDAVEPFDVLAAFGGFEVAVMVGVMLMATSKRHLIVVDGMPACAALMLAARIAPPVTDYCVFCRSHGHRGLDQTLHLFRASALLELNMDSTDGTGAILAWPLMKSAAALLAELADGEEPWPTHPDGLDDRVDPDEFLVEPQPVSSPFGPALY